VRKKNAALIKYPIPIALSMKKDSSPIPIVEYFHWVIIYFCIFKIYLDIVYYIVSIAIMGKCIDPSQSLSHGTSRLFTNRVNRVRSFQDLKDNQIPLFEMLIDPSLSLEKTFIRIMTYELGFRRYAFH
jgi:hypothetical protein